MKFNYQGRTKEGDIQAGVVEAASQEVAVKVLQSYGLVVTFLEKAGEEPFYLKSLRIFERITRKDLVVFLRELATMFKSEISLIEALRTLAEETENQTFKEKILMIGESVEGGTSFSEALAIFPELFPPFYINLVKSGEVSGKLSEVLEYLADHLEREYELSQRVLAMTVYPVFVLVVFSGVLLAMAIFVIPQLVKVLSAELQQLPLITRMVIAFTGFLRKYILLIIVVIGTLIFSLRRYKRTPEGKKRFDTLILKVPLAGKILKMIFVTRLAENLSTLISGGLPITKSLEILAGVVDNYCYQEIILEAKEEVRKGEMISRVLKKHPEYIPPFVSQMVLVGEKTGRLSEVLLNIVRFYEKEIEKGIAVLLSLLEPLLIIILGGAVGVLIGSILLPLYQVGQAVPIQ
ncbi:MAG: type II secretion system F family protein [bacterium]|nr:type II secretion system F family protein [bacterium]